ncbi:hypothetical protein IEQ_04936 [Bacillus cereus BAG6X1-2]|nr:hypothetical protein IEQ_04936 [Bacillus cereus BAG6X1-2]
MNTEINYVTDTDVDSEENAIEELSTPTTAPTAIEGWLQTLNPDTYNYYSNEDETDNVVELTDNQLVQNNSKKSALKLEKEDTTVSIPSNNTSDHVTINEVMNSQKEDITVARTHKEPIDFNDKSPVITEIPIEVPKTKHTPQCREPAYTSTVTYNQLEPEIKRTAEINDEK